MGIVEYGSGGAKAASLRGLAISSGLSLRKVLELAAENRLPPHQRRTTTTSPRRAQLLPLHKRRAWIKANRPRRTGRAAASLGGRAWLQRVRSCPFCTRKARSPLWTGLVLPRPIGGRVLWVPFSSPGHPVTLTITATRHSLFLQPNFVMRQTAHGRRRIASKIPGISRFSARRRNAHQVPPAASTAAAARNGHTGIPWACRTPPRPAAPGGRCPPWSSGTATNPTRRDRRQRSPGS